MKKLILVALVLLSQASFAIEDITTPKKNEIINVKTDKDPFLTLVFSNLLLNEPPACKQDFTPMIVQWGDGSETAYCVGVYPQQIYVNATKACAYCTWQLGVN